MNLPLASLLELKRLEQDGLHLFHGSGVALDALEPRQANTRHNGDFRPDGDPAVFASQYLDYAIFMALINPETCPAGLRACVSYEDGCLRFSATQQTLDQIHDLTSGFVYVLLRDQFVQRNQSEWLTQAPVQPVTVCRISRQDFTPAISIIEN